MCMSRGRLDSVAIARNSGQDCVMIWYESMDINVNVIVVLTTSNR